VTERLLNADELGQLLGLTKGTVLDRWEAGDLPGFRLFGRKGGPVRFRLSEVEAVLEGWRSGPEPAMMKATHEMGRQPRKAPARTQEGKSRVEAEP
jgi:predicted DNA-binding transcriptional regulator AlpA